MGSPDDSDGIGVLLLTAAQAAALCQVGVDKVYEWAREPGFPVAINTRHQMRIHARLFEEWLERRALQPRDDQGEESQEAVA